MLDDVFRIVLTNMLVLHRPLSDLKSKRLCGGRRGSERPRRIVLR